MEVVMNQETLKALTELSNKLGTTAEYLWSVLVKQAPISGLISLFEVAATLAAIYFLFAAIKRKVATYKDVYPVNDHSTWLWLIFCIACVFAFSIVCLGIGEAITAFVNPEYWALSKIIGSH